MAADRDSTSEDRQVADTEKRTKVDDGGAGSRLRLQRLLPKSRSARRREKMSAPLLLSLQTNAGNRSVVGFVREGAESEFEESEVVLSETPLLPGFELEGLGASPEAPETPSDAAATPPAAADAGGMGGPNAGSGGGGSGVDSPGEPAGAGALAVQRQPDGSGRPLAVQRDPDPGSSPSPADPGSQASGAGLTGSYKAVVVNNVDPQSQNRLQVQVPDASVDLAWAAPAGGSTGPLPAVGDEVTVQFQNGDATQPMWTSGASGASQQSQGAGNLDGPHKAVVVNNTDPESQSRLQVQIPDAGIDLTWATPQGGNANGPMPAVGDQVTVQFVNGDASHAVWIGGSSSGSTPTDGQQAGSGGQLTGSYKAVVINSADPTSQNRLQVQVPDAGIDLAWATPAGSSVGQLPAVGDEVTVQFTNGDASYPVWSGGTAGSSSSGSGSAGGVHSATVVNNVDPQSQSRLQVQIPDMGIDLTWASPQGGGGTLPAVGDKVTIQFPNGDTEHPVWISGGGGQ